MPSTVSDVRILSGSADGKGIKVTQTASPGTTIHNPGSGNFDEVELLAVNTDSVERTLTVEWGGTTNPDNRIPVVLLPGDGLVLVHKGLINGANEIKAFASAANVIMVYGKALRIT